MTFRKTIYQGLILTVVMCFYIFSGSVFAQGAGDSAYCRKRIQLNLITNIMRYQRRSKNTSHISLRARQRHRLVADDRNRLHRQLVINNAKMPVMTLTLSWPCRCVKGWRSLATSPTIFHYYFTRHCGRHDFAHSNYDRN
jgi:hypothetical protein